MLGIIGAMDVEIDTVKSKLQSQTVTRIAGMDFVCGTLEGVMVCAAQCSPGKVNAAMCAQIMIDRFKVSCVINIGVGCSLSERVVIKNVVIATDVCEYDVDITALGEPRGYINGLNMIQIPTDKALSDELAQTAIICGEKIHRGSVASGDTFIANNDLKAMLSEDFGAICGEMEGGAIGHVCAANGVPFAVLRSISDGGNADAQLDYPTFKTVAANISTSIILNFIKKQKTQITFEL